MKMTVKHIFASFLVFLAGVPLFPQADLNLLDSAAKAGVTVYWDTLSQSGILEKNGRQVSFRAGDRLVLLDNSRLSISDAPFVKDGTILVTRHFLEEAETFFNTKDAERESYRIGAILIDPGHGGKDPGAAMTHKIDGKSVNMKEKDITLSVGKMLYDKLSSTYPDKKIILTRSKDEFLTLQQRTEMANTVKLKDNEAVLYVSVHVNSSLDKKARGYEAWYLSPETRRTVINSSGSQDQNLFRIMNSMMEEEYTTESILIAKFIMDGLQNQVGSISPSRGIKAQEWFVVKNSYMPSVLVELGFISNEQEAKLLNGNTYLQKLAFGIYNGISAFVTYFERSRGFTGTK